VNSAQPGAQIGKGRNDPNRPGRVSQDASGRQTPGALGCRGCAPKKSNSTGRETRVRAQQNQRKKVGGGEGRGLDPRGTQEKHSPGRPLSKGGEEVDEAHQRPRDKTSNLKRSSIGGLAKSRERAGGRKLKEEGCPLAKKKR